MSDYKIKLLKKDSKVNSYIQNKEGDLGNFYSPLQNLESKSGLGDFTTKNLNLDYQQPVELEITDEYDGSQNIIINDDINQPKLINSRMSVQENNTFLIPEHMGNSVNNIYEDSELEITANLLKLYQHIPSLTFDGLSDGGAFKCGSYIFYFKLSDADNNLTNVIQESSIVQVHIGQVGTNKVRMGQEDENAGKNISFTLDGIDAGFDYVRVFYERTSSSGATQAYSRNYFMIDQNFPINNGKCQMLLTGEEPEIQITDQDLQTEFADIQSAKTSAINSNILFLGNISSYQQNMKDLQQIAWMITPSFINDKKVGEINKDYDFSEGAQGYYNVKNVYNYTGYWPDEYYRFGIAFIYDNNLISQVFNIQGADLSVKAVREADSKNNIWEEVFLNGGDYWEATPEDGIFNKDYMTNSRGVVKFPSKNLLGYSDEKFAPTTLGVKFNLSHIVDGWKTLHPSKRDKYNTIQEILKSYHIKGFFFTRQKRIPSIFAQGIVVGLTQKDFGALPVIQGNDNNYVTKSFLSPQRLLLPIGSTVIISQAVENKAVFVPDAELQEPTYNEIFNGQEFALCRVATSSQKYANSRAYITDVKDDEKSFSRISKVTSVPKDTKILTDGENYFSTLAGDAADPVKTSDVNLSWDKTPPQDLTASTSLVRGKWGYFVGISNGLFDYGDIINIKAKGFLDNAVEQNQLEFKKRFDNYSGYSAISSRFNISDLQDGKEEKDSITCYRGDCYTSLFTHKVMNNFADTEMPTNTKVIDPACWCNNYAVRCTATIQTTTKSNLLNNTSGWYIPEPENIQKKNKTLQIVFGILAGNYFNLGTQYSDNRYVQDTYANEIVQAFETKNAKYDDGDKGNKGDIHFYYTDDEGKQQPYEDLNIKNESDISLVELARNGFIQKVDPQEQENKSGINIKAIFKNTANWTLRGIASINRADVNAVSYAQWITFPICSSLNLAFRDVDFGQATEEATFNRKRSFFPLDAMDETVHMVESNHINYGAKKSIAAVQKSAFKQVPFIKQEFFNRIYWSRPNVSQQFINSYRMIYNQQFKEYNKEWGAITKLVSIQNTLLVVFQHGMGLLPVNTTPTNELEASPYLAFRSVLPPSIQEVSSTIGSMWKDSVIQSTTGAVYGVDTVAKKIWVFANGLQSLSDFKVTKFLNDFIDLSEFDFQEYIGHVNVKSHYNAFKNDIIFTFYRDKVAKWDLTEAQKILITEDFYQTHGKVSEDRTLPVEPEHVIDSSIKMSDTDSGIIIDYKKVKEVQEKTIVLNYSENIPLIIKNFTKPVIYNSEYDTNNRAINLLASSNYIINYDRAKNCWVAIPRKSGLKIEEIEARVFEVELPDKDIYVLKGLKLIDYKSEGQALYFYTTADDFTKEYKIRKGYVYNNDGKQITPATPIAWEPGTTWALCYNEAQQQFTTFYDWYPLQSENIDNIFFSFDKDQMDDVLDKVYKDKIKYGFNGTIKANVDDLKPLKEITPKSYQLGKRIIDRSFNNKVTEYYVYEDQAKTITWYKSILPSYPVICFYTKEDAKVKGNDVHCEKINFGNDEYYCYICYLTGQQSGSISVTVNGKEMTLADIHEFSMEYLKEKNLFVNGKIILEEGNLSGYDYRNSAPDSMKLWKHGQAGLYDIQGKIKPTNWYGKQHEFNFEFIVNDTPDQQKVFNNLILISNKAEPGKFEFEVVGEGYEWFDYKPIVLWANKMIGKENKFQNPTTTFNNLDDVYNEIIGRNSTDIQKVYPDFPDFIKEGDYYHPTPRTIQKLPYLKLKLTDKKGTPEKPLYSWSKEGFNDYWEDYRDIQKYPSKDHNFSFNCNEVCLVEDDQLNEQRVHSEQLGNNMKKYGRVRGNMQYLEDSWKVEIRPIQFKWAYKVDGVYTKKKLETKNRDKYLKVKVRYSGEDLAIITAVATLFDESYA